MEGRLWKRKLLGNWKAPGEKYGKKIVIFKKMDQIPTWKKKVIMTDLKGLMKHGKRTWITT